MESEILSMTADLFSLPDAYGVTTSGGTDSILQAMYAYKLWGRAKGITKPNMYKLLINII